MRAFSFSRFTAAVGVAALLATTTLPARAAPVPSSTVALKSAIAGNVIDVRVRRGSRGAGIAAGIATGLMLGGIIGSSGGYGYYDGYYGGPPPIYSGPQVFYPPGYYGPVYGPRYRPYYGRPSGWVAYCFSRYRSFDPVSGTYLGYDGRRHACR
jgi:hypothetical protein